MLSALSVWVYFSISFNMGALSLITNYTLVQRTPCPRAVLPLASVLTNLPALVLPSVAAILVAAIGGHLSPRVVLVPLGVAWLMALTGGVVLLAAGVAARYRDVAQAIPFLLQFGVFAAPIGYSLSQLDSAARLAVSLNPMTGVIELWRWSILQPYDLRIGAIALGLGVSVAVVVVAWRVFSRLEVTMADYI